MSKIIEVENGFHTELNIYEKYFKMDFKERHKYFKFLFSLISALCGLTVTLIIAFTSYWKYFICADILILLLSVPFYFFLIKEKGNGIGIHRL